MFKEKTAKALAEFMMKLPLKEPIQLPEVVERAMISIGVPWSELDERTRQVIMMIVVANEDSDTGGAALNNFMFGWYIGRATVAESKPEIKI